MRHDMPSEAVILGIQPLGDLRKPFTAHLDVIHEIAIKPYILEEPDRSRIVYSDVPASVHLGLRVDRHFAYALGRFGGSHLGGVIRPLNTGIEAALIFALVGIIIHCRPRVGQFLSAQKASLRRPKLPKMPAVFTALCPLPKVVKDILAAWGAEECSPTLPIRKRRPNNLRPCPRIHVAKLIENDAIEILAAHGIVIVSPEQSASPTIRKVCPKLSLVELHAGNRRAIMLHVIPCDGFGLPEQGRDVPKPWIRALALDRRPD